MSFFTATEPFAFLSCAEEPMVKGPNEDWTFTGQQQVSQDTTFTVTATGARKEFWAEKGSLVATFVRTGVPATLPSRRVCDGEPGASEVSLTALPMIYRVFEPSHTFSYADETDHRIPAGASISKTYGRISVTLESESVVVPQSAPTSDQTETPNDEINTAPEPSDLSRFTKVQGQQVPKIEFTTGSTDYTGPAGTIKDCNRFLQNGQLGRYGTGHFDVDAKATDCESSVVAWNHTKNDAGEFVQMKRNIGITGLLLDGEDNYRLVNTTKWSDQSVRNGGYHRYEARGTLISEALSKEVATARSVHV